MIKKWTTRIKGKGPNVVNKIDMLVKDDLRELEMGESRGRGTKLRQIEER